MKNIAIMTSGGDAAGMNPSVKRLVDYGIQRGLKPFLIHKGLTGLVDNLIEEAIPAKMGGFIYHGGTILRSSRCPEFYQQEVRQKAYDNLKKLDIDAIVVIGGDGSFSALNRFSEEFSLPFIGIPATIDNDIYGTDYCLGVDTALNIILQSVDSIRDTAYSMPRAFIVETMGRRCGYLAMMSAITCGANICIAPEIEADFSSIKKRLEKEVDLKNDFIIGIVAEGTNKAAYLTEWIKQELGMDARLTLLGHIQRGGSPTARDRIMGYRFAVAAIDALITGNHNQIIVSNDGEFAMRNLTDIVDKEWQPSDRLKNLCQHLSC